MQAGAGWERHTLVGPGHKAGAGGTSTPHCACCQATPDWPLILSAPRPLYPMPCQVLREFNKVADALSNQAIDDYRSGINRQLWTLEAAVAAAHAAGGGGGLAAELDAADAFYAELLAEEAEEAAAAEPGGAGEVAADEGGSEGSAGDGEEPAKRARHDS